MEVLSKVLGCIPQLELSQAQIKDAYETAYAPKAAAAEGKTPAAERQRLFSVIQKADKEVTAKTTARSAQAATVLSIEKSLEASRSITRQCEAAVAAAEEALVAARSAFKSYEERPADAEPSQREDAEADEDDSIDDDEIAEAIQRTDKLVDDATIAIALHRSDCEQLVLRT